MQETWVRSLGREDPLEEGMAIHSSILAWRVSQTEEPGGLRSMVGPLRPSFHHFLFLNFSPQVPVCKDHNSAQWSTFPMHFTQC